MTCAIVWVPALFPGRGLNDRQHWSVRAKANKHARGAVIWAFTQARLRRTLTLPPGPPWDVTLVRVYAKPSRPLDDDNWVGACKGIRDQVADELRVNDGNRRAVRFFYDQIEGADAGVRIEIRERAAAQAVGG